MVSNDERVGGASGTMTRVQMFKHVTKDRLLDISDLLSLDPRRNKIGFTLVEWDSETRGAAAKTRVRHFVDVPDFKLVCWDILNGTFSEWTDHKGTPVTRGDHSGEDGTLQARVLTLRKDSKYRQPYVLKIDNGAGEQIGGGAVKMVRATESLTLLMPEWDARRMAQTVLDYVRDWETVNFRKRQEAQTVVIPLPGVETPKDEGDDTNRFAAATAEATEGGRAGGASGEAASQGRPGRRYSRAA